MEAHPEAAAPANPVVSRMTPPAPPAIEADNLTKIYDGAPAVDALSFRVEAGSVVGLLGGNGAGKTTTLSMIMGLTTPTQGSVKVFGADMAHERNKVLHRINFESPYADLPHRLTVRQNLTVFGKLYGVTGLKQRIDELARALDLVDFLDRRTGQLSAGQKTRAALAKALINEPDLLLLDEPTASLDPDTADWVRGHLEEFRRRRGAAILLASHNMGEVERLCDRVIIMRTGRIVHDEPPEALIARYGRETLEEVFLDVARGRGGMKSEAVSLES
ncbi:ABC-2 type transport system ATP-binding protein [Rhizobiales bacterium GAS191]|nr:ABC-2 type transport system ATP-binding protein [Rhizobiales bacterium GAS188]SEE88183.1 ABC-2 type transport system ATP-binding protein [Rhizobiales bacterium GAS191]